MPPCSLISSKRILTPFDEVTPYVAATPDRSVCMPKVISVGVTPRCCAKAPGAMASTAKAIAIPAFLIILLPPLACVGIHAVDHRLVLLADELALELHGRRDLVVLGRELLLDQPELLDRLDPREACVDPLDLRPDQVLHLARAAQRGEVGERHVAVLRV